MINVHKITQENIAIMLEKIAFFTTLIMVPNVLFSYVAYHRFFAAKVINDSNFVHEYLDTTTNFTRQPSDPSTFGSNEFLLRKRSKK